MFNEALLCSRRSASFTIIELMTIMVIMALVMSLVVMSVIDWSRVAAMRGSAAAVETGLQAARQQAIVTRSPVSFTGSDSHRIPGWFLLADGEGQIGMSNNLNRGIAFHQTSATQATFTASGAVSEGTLMFILDEPHRGERALTATIEVYGITGHIEIVP